MDGLMDGWMEGAMFYTYFIYIARVGCGVGDGGWCLVGWVGVTYLS